MNEDDGPIMLTSRTKRVSDKDTILLNEEAFYFEIDGKTPRGESLKKKKGNAAIKREGRAVKKIIDAIMDPSLNEEQQVKALNKAAQHPKARRIFKSAKLIDAEEQYSETYGESNEKVD